MVPTWRWEIGLHPHQSLRLASLKSSWCVWVADSSSPLRHQAPCPCVCTSSCQSLDPWTCHRSFGCMPWSAASLDVTQYLCPCCHTLDCYCCYLLVLSSSNTSDGLMRWYITWRCWYSHTLSVIKCLCLSDSSSHDYLVVVIVRLVNLIGM